MEVRWVMGICGIWNGICGMIGAFHLFDENRAVVGNAPSLPQSLRDSSLAEGATCRWLAEPMGSVGGIGAVSPLRPFGTALPEGEPRVGWLMKAIAVPPSGREVGEARRERGGDVGWESLLSNDP